MAIGEMIVAHQCLCEAMTDDLEVQMVNIPIVLHEQRACLPLDRKTVVAPVHADEVYPMKRMNGIEIYRKSRVAGNSVVFELHHRPQ